MQLGCPISALSSWKVLPKHASAAKFVTMIVMQYAPEIFPIVCAASCKIRSSIGRSKEAGKAFSTSAITADRQ
jgi:hypothetical protein